MKKYLFIIKATLLEQLQYVKNIFGGFVCYGLIIFVFLQLWQYLYGRHDFIAGYSLKQMIWYVIIAELLWFSIRNKILKSEIKNDIKSGKIAYHINKPYNYLGYIFSKGLGIVIINFTLYAIFSIIMGIVYIGGISNFSIIYIPFIIINFVLAITILILIYILLGLICFWNEENAPFVWIFEKIFLILGITFPIQMLPLWLGNIVKITPVYAVTYASAKMVVDFSYGEFFIILMSQIIWLVILLVVINFIFMKGVKKVNVNGG
jgi:ABC-2 type transport system permease protein